MIKNADMLLEWHNKEYVKTRLKFVFMKWKREIEEMLYEWGNIFIIKKIVSIF